MPALGLWSMENEDLTLPFQKEGLEALPSGRGVFYSGGEGLRVLHGRDGLITEGCKSIDQVEERGLCADITAKPAWGTAGNQMGWMFWVHMKI